MSFHKKGNRKKIELVVRPGTKHNRLNNMLPNLKGLSTFSFSKAYWYKIVESDFLETQHTTSVLSENELGFREQSQFQFKAMLNLIGFYGELDQIWESVPFSVEIRFFCS